MPQRHHLGRKRARAVEAKNRVEAARKRRKSKAKRAAKAVAK